MSVEYIEYELKKIFTLLSIGVTRDCTDDEVECLMRSAISLIGVVQRHIKIYRI